MVFTRGTTGRGLLGRLNLGQLPGISPFTVQQNGASVPVVYHGSDPVPDTFKDGASVLVEGTAGPNGTFVGKKIQAKCASKYESDPASAYDENPGPTS